jgi:RNA polymerase sigma-70 factor (ECF subfamily)
MKNDELIEKVKENDFKAFHLLVQQYERLVFSIILKIVPREEDVADLAQEVFLQVFKKIKTYRAESSLATWIGRIAYNHALNHIKKHNKVYVKDSEREIDKQNNEPSPEETIIKEEKSSYIQQQIKSLPQKYRTVLTLYHFNEMSYKEIAELTESSESSVKTNIFRARKLLKDRLKDYLNY